MKPAEVAQVLRAPLLNSQKIILLALMVANRPLSMQELLSELNRPASARRNAALQMAYMVKIKVVAIDKSETAHKFSLARLP